MGNLVRFYQNYNELKLIPNAPIQVVIYPLYKVPYHYP